MSNGEPEIIGDTQTEDLLAGDIQPGDIQPGDIRAEDILGKDILADASQAEEIVYDVGGFIREHRERANLSLRRLADRAGISNPYLSQIERGIRKPSAEILKRLSRALEISAESLYSKAGLIDAGPAAPTVVEAIEADRRLTPRQKQVLLDLYRALAEAGSIAEEQE